MGKCVESVQEPWLSVCRCREILSIQVLCSRVAEQGRPVEMLQNTGGYLHNMVHASGEKQAAYLTQIAVQAAAGGTPPLTPRSAPLTLHCSQPLGVGSATLVLGHDLMLAMLCSCCRPWLGLMVAHRAAAGLTSVLRLVAPRDDGSLDSLWRSCIHTPCS